MISLNQLPNSTQTLFRAVASANQGDLLNDMLLIGGRCVAVGVSGLKVVPE